MKKLLETQHSGSEEPSACSFLCGQRSAKSRDLTWVDAVNFYPAPRECLEAFLVASAAEVLAGVKPANLIRVLKRALPCGRSIYNLWCEFGGAVLKDSSLSFMTLRDDDEGLTLLLYHPELLKRRLTGRTMSSFLRRRGYPAPLTLTSALDYLRQSFVDNDSPDEVGMFLGYPLKDVHGFIKQRSEPWSGKCLWRIYGPPHRSLKLYQRYYAERKALTGQLMEGVCPRTLLAA